jgi:hypothetical protein
LYPEYAAMQKKNDEKNGEQNLSVQDNKDE